MKIAASRVGLADQVVLVSKIHAAPGKRAEIEQVIRDFYAEVKRKEPGCLANVMHRPVQDVPVDPNAGFLRTVDDENTLVFYEVYRDVAASRYHPTTPHFAVMMRSIQNLMASPIELQFLEAVAHTGQPRLAGAFPSVFQPTKRGGR